MPLSSSCHDGCGERVPQVEVGLLICSNTTIGREERSGLVYNAIFIYCESLMRCTALTGVTRVYEIVKLLITLLAKCFPIETLAFRDCSLTGTRTDSICESRRYHPQTNDLPSEMTLFKDSSLTSTKTDSTHRRRRYHHMAQQPPKRKPRSAHQRLVGKTYQHNVQNIQHLPINTNTYPQTPINQSWRMEKLGIQKFNYISPKTPTETKHHHACIFISFTKVYEKRQAPMAHPPYS